MTEVPWVAILATLVPITGLIGTLIGARLKRKTDIDTAQDRLVDQLQEELARYRDVSDKRAAATEHKVERLEIELRELREENRGYRAFIGVQRDRMAEHNVPLPPWPENLPR